MINIGDSLLQARRSRGLDLADAAKGVHLRELYLRALEEEEFDQLPPGAYRWGFLRTYANFLGLDADMLVDEYLARYGRSRQTHRRTAPLWRPLRR